MKKEINVDTGRTIDLNYRSLKEMKEEIQFLIDAYGENSRIERKSYGYGDGSGSYEEFSIYITRLETDEEYNNRLKDEERYKKLQEVRDQAEYKRLQEKYRNQK